MKAIDRRHIKQRTEFFSLCFDTNISLQDIACFQIKSTDLCRRNIDIIFTGKIIFASDKSIAIRKHFQNTVCLFATVKLCSICRHSILIFQAAASAVFFLPVIPFAGIVTVSIFLHITILPVRTILVSGRGFVSTLLCFLSVIVCFLFRFRLFFTAFCFRAASFFFVFLKHALNQFWLSHSRDSSESSCLCQLFQCNK